MSTPPGGLVSGLWSTSPHVPTSFNPPGRTAAARRCEKCPLIGLPWVHLRLCLTCGHVGCCDSSPHRHARAHAHTIGHAIVRSFEPGEDRR